MRLDVAVIGAGQAGLAIAGHLRGSGLRVTLFDRAERVGDSWRCRWDSLRLFTPARYSQLRGLPFPGSGDRHPGKDEVADYLAAYAAQVGAPVEVGVEVTELAAAESGDGFTLVTSGGRSWTAGQVVVATGPFQEPVRPAFAARLDAGVVQVHSHDYRNPAQVPAGGPIVVVGRGNSGVQIAAELVAAGRDVVLAGRAQPYLPQRILGRDVFWWLHRPGLLHAPTGSWRGRLLRRRGEPVIGTDVGRLVRAGRVRLVPQAVDANGRWLCFDGGQRLAVAAVVWATGYRPHYPWLRLPVLDAAGRPEHRRGVTAVPGLYFVGLPWQSQRGSALLDGVDRDAYRLARTIVARDAGVSADTLG
ncbi:flavin-containing monooxygenase [Plantactinospora mayteni]|uniref:flavin-containing monooxygenase n=1 Tax=Plantactinospora mayteni TaxID=566021 RepID=UPI0019428C60|nr:NAD(P)/FAD-dependent oxidoreductase [Plantactinospora mayteni]